MAIAKGLNLATPPAAIEVCSRSLISRDPSNAHLLHVRVIVFHGGSGCDGATRPPPHISPLDLDSFEIDYFPPLKSDEMPLGYAHVILLRCDLSTTGEELQQALRNVCDTISSHGHRASRAVNYLMDEITPDALEDTMEAADDRWIDQVATVEAFAASPGLQAADLYAACLKDLLPFTNPTSGLVVCSEYPCAPEGSTPPEVDLEKARLAFHDQETDLRSIITVGDDGPSDRLWLVAGLAQADRKVPGQSWVRILDSLRYMSARK